MGSGRVPRSDASAHRNLKYPWAPSLYAVSYIDTAVGWEALDYEEWASTGFASPRVTDWIDGTVVYHL
jgi:hypothetical protein